MDRRGLGGQHGDALAAPAAMLWPRRRAGVGEREVIVSAAECPPSEDGEEAGVALPGDPVAQAIASRSGQEPLASFDPNDARVPQILSTEHWSLLSARSLGYNEVFTRVGTFLTLVSMSLVGLALFAQALEFGPSFLIIAAGILSFDLLVGLATTARVLGAIDDDLRALHGMSRIRHGYIELVPQLRPYFTAPVHDDVRSVLAVYGPRHAGLAGLVYFLSTSLGLMVLLVALIAGVTAGVTVMAVGGGTGVGVGIGVTLSVAAFLALGLVSRRSILLGQAALESIFPAPADHH